MRGAGGRRDRAARPALRNGCLLGCIFEIQNVPSSCFASEVTEVIISPMESVKYIYWQDNNQWLGYLQDYPDYWTQGESFEDLQSHLRDLYRDLTSRSEERRVGKEC